LFLHKNGNKFVCHEKKQRVYCFRLQNLVIEGGAYVIRGVLDHLTGVPLTVHLQNNGTNITHPKIRSQPGQTQSLTQTHYDKLFVSPGIPFDITLLVYLLQNKCGFLKGPMQMQNLMTRKSDTVSSKCDIFKKG
jgi:hypothetical protein